MDESSKTKIAVVCGPTASGKTLLAASLAKCLGGEVVSADSMQVYQGMEIATAKPTEEEMLGVKHHLIGFLEPGTAFSVADYVARARGHIREISGRGMLPIIAGGTGLYIQALVDHISFDEAAPGADTVFREEMKALAAEKGNAFVLEKLREIDPETAERLHPNNLSRIVRALEVYRLSGKTMSRLQAESRREASPFAPVMMMIDWPRDRLYERIDRRVDSMMERGLLREAEMFFSGGEYPTASQAIGYKELKPYFDGRASLDECIEKLKQETRKYAKRQLTWFRKDTRIHRLLMEGSANFADILKNSEKLVKNGSNTL